MAGHKKNAIAARALINDVERTRVGVSRNAHEQLLNLDHLGCTSMEALLLCLAELKNRKNQFAVGASCWCKSY